MKLNEAILLEDPQTDMMYRRRAEEAYNDLISSIERIGGIMGMRPIGDAMYAPASLLRHPEMISLVIRHRQEGTRAIGGIGFDDNDESTLHLFVDFDNDIMEQLNRRDYRKTVVHEFIHKFDKERMSHMPSTSHLSQKNYYNSPVETNAYVQEAIYDFESIFQKLPPATRDMQLDRIERNFDDFLGLMRMLIDDDFLGNMNVQVDRNMRKRLYKYWDEVVRQGELR